MEDLSQPCYRAAPRVIWRVIFILVLYSRPFTVVPAPHDSALPLCPAGLVMGLRTLSHWNTETIASTRTDCCDMRGRHKG